MKRFPEKTVMAVIILSCGFLAQSEPSAGDRKPKHVEAKRATQPRPASSPAVIEQQKARLNYAKAVTP
jgi:hypothetical protein